jgi:hypothetical protein
MRMHGSGTRRRVVPRAPEPPNETESNPALKMRSKIDNEVRPSTVKTWLTIWRHVLTQPTDHWLRLVAENRMRTPYATNILARINTVFYPTRPRREMQSYPRPRSLSSLFPLSRAPPEIVRLTFTRQLLTGNSVEIVREHDQTFPFDSRVTNKNAAIVRALSTSAMAATNSRMLSTISAMLFVSISLNGTSS